MSPTTMTPNAPAAPAQTPTPTAPRPTSLSLSGRTLFSAANQQAQMVATAHFSDGSSQIVTDRVFGWNSSNKSVATVSLTGVLTTGGAGITDISGLHDAGTGIVQVVVSPIPNAQQTLTGTLSGIVTLSNGSTGPMTLVLEQNGNRITGHGRVAYQPSGSFPLIAAVLVEGTVNGSSLNLNLQDNDGSCPKLFTNSVAAFTNSMIRGSFEKRGGCDSLIATATYSIAKQ